MSSVARRWPVPVQLFAAAAALRIASFLVFYLGSLLSGHGGHVDPYDSSGIDRWAWYAAQNLAHGRLVNLSAYNLEGSWETGFTYFVALQYLVFGHHSEVPRLVNTLLAAFTAPAAYLTGRQTALGEAVARRAGWLVAAWPLSVYWAGYDLLKDPATWFLVALAMLAVVSSSTLRFALLGLAAAVPMLVIRIYVAAGLFLFLPVAAAIRRRWLLAGGIVAVLLLAQGALVAAGHPAVWSAAPYQGNGEAIAPTVYAEGSVRGFVVKLTGDPRAAAKIAGQGTDAISLIRASPRVAAVRAVLGLVLTVGGPRFALKDVLHPTLDSGMYPGLLLWLLLVPFTGLGLFRGLRLGDRRVLCLAILCLGLWVGVGYLFAGGGYRQREMAFPVTLLFTSLGLERPWPRRWWAAYAALSLLGVLVVLGRELRVY